MNDWTLISLTHTSTDLKTESRCYGHWCEEPRCGELWYNSIMPKLSNLHINSSLSVSESVKQFCIIATEQSRQEFFLSPIFSYLVCLSKAWISEASISTADTNMWLNRLSSKVICCVHQLQCKIICYDVNLSKTGNWVQMKNALSLNLELMKSMF